MTGDSRSATLDGLRALAALAVVYNHYVFLTGIAPRPGAGNTGVVIFFVLSGYLITHAVWRDGTGMSSQRYRAFLRRRVERLYPALIGLLLTAMPVVAWLGPQDVAQVVRDSGIALGQLTSPLYVAGIVGQGPLYHTWSLTVEWVFYLLWPLVIVVLHRRGTAARGARRVAWASAGILYLGSLPLSPTAFYYLPPSNLPAMLVGAALALGHAARPSSSRAGRPPGIVNLALMLFVLMVFLPSNSTGSWLYRVTLFPIAVAAAYIVIDQRPGITSIAHRLLGARPMSSVGLASYSLYLWHLPVLWIVWWGLPGLSPVARALTAVVALIPLVYISFRYLERPWLRLPATKPHSGSLPSPSRVRTVET